MIITDDWRDHVAWRRSELEAELKHALEAGGRTTLRGDPDALLERVATLRRKLAALALVVCEAERLESEAK